MIGTMTVSELKAAIENGEEIILIDCREQDEWDAGHVEQAMFKPLSDFENQTKDLTNPNAKVAIMCRSGKRSMSACQFLAEEKEFNDLYNVTGGILAWEEEGYPVSK
jgi:rhodanese-related sulfurtransferase